MTTPVGGNVPLNWLLTAKKTQKEKKENAVTCQWRGRKLSRNVSRALKVGVRRHLRNPDCPTTSVSVGGLQQNGETWLICLITWKGITPATMQKAWKHGPRRLDVQVLAVQASSGKASSQHLWLITTLVSYFRAKDMIYMYKSLVIRTFRKLVVFLSMLLYSWMFTWCQVWL